MASPPASHIVGIKVHGVTKYLIDGATVTFTLNSEIISGVTNSAGEVVLNTADFPSGWSVGDVVSITASKSAEGTVTQDLTLTSSPQTIELTLAETSNFSIDMHSPTTKTTNYLAVNASILYGYDGKKITLDNPLPVIICEIQYKILNAMNSDTINPEYQGKALPGTPSDAARWRIQKFVYGNGTRKPATEILWAGGSSEFNFVWDNRAQYDYS